MKRLSKPLWEQAIKDMVGDMQEHDFDVKKKSLTHHAQEMLAGRLKTLQEMSDRFEEMIKSATIQAYDQPLRDANRKQMVTVLQGYPKVRKKTATAIVTELYGE